MSSTQGGRMVNPVSVVRRKDDPEYTEVPRDVLNKRSNYRPVVLEGFNPNNRKMGKRLKAVNAQKRAQILALHAQGKYSKTIARQLGLSEQTIRKEINAVVAEFQAEGLKSVAHKIAKEDAFLYLIQVEALDAWYKSKEGKITNNKKRATEIRKGMGGPPHKKKKMSRAAIDAQTNEALEALFDADPEGIDEIIDGVIEKDEEYQRIEETAGEAAFLKILLEVHKARVGMHNLHPREDFNGHAGAIGGQGEFADFTPAQRAARIAEIIEKAKMAKARQLSLQGQPIDAVTVQVVRREALPAVPAQAEDNDLAEDDLEDLWDATA